MDLANVTPHALIAWKSQGASRDISEFFFMLVSNKSSAETSLALSQRPKYSLMSLSSSKSLIVGISFDVMSYT